LVLLAISSLGCLALVAKSRWQRSTIKTLQQQLKAAGRRPPQPQLAETPPAQQAQAARKA
jgi:hypothetical protein